MSFLKGNFRSKAIDADYTAVGGGIQNWIAGSNVNPDFRFGGLVIASFASGLSGAGFLLESAVDLLGSTYGITMVSNMLLGGSGSVGSNSGIGFKVVPMGFADYSGDGGSAVVWYHLSATGVLSGDDSIAVIVGQRYSGTGASGVTVASNISVHFAMWGLIVSAPFNTR